jgi:hypothetical protein
MFEPDTSCFGGMVAERGSVERFDGARVAKVPR